MDNTPGQTRSDSARIIVATLAGFAASYLLSRWWMQDLYDFLYSLMRVKAVAYPAAWLITALPAFAVLLMIHKPAYFFHALGLNARLLNATAITLAATLPMLGGYALLMEFDASLTVNRLLVMTLFAALFEEVLYRGFLFGQLFRFTRLGFIPAVGLSALIFAMGHLYQSTDPGVLAGIFFTTLLGGAFFAWLYAEWEYNLWIPVMLHLFMNLAWILFGAGDNAMGGVLPNLFRIITIALMVLLTLRHRRRTGGAPAVNRHTVWFRKSMPNSSTSPE